MLYVKPKKKSKNQQSKNISFSDKELNVINCFSSVDELCNFLNKVVNFGRYRSRRNLFDFDRLPQKTKDQIYNEDLKIMARIQKELGDEDTARELASAAMERDAMIANGQSPKNFWDYKGPQKAK